MYEKGKYGLHKKGQIVKICMWSTTITPQELHFKIKRKAKWGFEKDFICFSNSKRKLRKIRRKRKGETK
jgi:hypothetical protein